MKHLLCAVALAMAIGGTADLYAAPLIDNAPIAEAPALATLGLDGVAMMVEAAGKDADVKARLAELALAGWRADFAAAQGDSAELPGKDDAVLGNAKSMARLYVPLSSVANPALKAALVFGMADNGLSFVAIAPHADDTTGVGLAAVTGAMDARAATDAAHLIDGSLAPDRQKVTYPHYWSCKYVNKIGTSVACFSLWGNPFGAYYSYLVRYGYAKSSSQYFGWYASWTGCGVACPCVVTTTSGRGLVCGQVPNTSSCTGF